MQFAAVFWSLLSWTFRQVVLKFLVMGVIFVIVSELTPLVIEHLGGFVGANYLSSAFSGIPSGVWYFLDFFALDVGFPLLISAHVSRFLIRRIPFIG